MHGSSGSGLCSDVSSPLTVNRVTVDISAIRGDGGTQGRVVVNPRIIKEYAELMRSGVEFPPVRIWFDGVNYWLSDGFQRLAAAEAIGWTRIEAVVFSGSVDDARWDSYAANSAHGFRRTKRDIDRILGCAFAHPKAALMSNREIARHIGVGEPTVRRWRRGLSASNDADGARVVMRGGTRYTLRTRNIGHISPERQDQARRCMRQAGCGDYTPVAPSH